MTIPDLITTPDLDGTSSEPRGGVSITTRRLSKTYRREAALTDVALTAPAGAVYMLAGANGAGKTTLLRMLLNLERADSGEIRVGGLDPRRQGPAVRAQLGYVPDRFDTGPGWMSAGLWLEQRSAYYPAWDGDHLDVLCRRLEIDRGRKLGQLSKGQARRVQLAAALAHRPALLVLDEPIDGLDPVAKDAFLGLVSDHLADTGCTVLVSSHQIHEIDGLTDHVGVLAAGCLTFQGSRETLHRTLKIYSAAGPDGWTGPPDLTGVLHKGRFGRDIQWTVQGEEADIVARITASGGVVRNVTPLNLHDAVVTLMRGKDPA